MPTTAPVLPAAVSPALPLTAAQGSPFAALVTLVDGSAPLITPAPSDLPVAADVAPPPVLEAVLGQLDVLPANEPTLVDPAIVFEPEVAAQALPQAPIDLVAPDAAEEQEPADAIVDAAALALLTPAAMPAVATPTPAADTAGPRPSDLTSDVSLTAAPAPAPAAAAAASMQTTTPLAVMTSDATPAEVERSIPSPTIRPHGSQPTPHVVADTAADARTPAAVPDQVAASVFAAALADQAPSGTVTADASGDAPLEAVAALQAPATTGRAEASVKLPPVLPQVHMPQDPEAGFDSMLGSRISVMLDQGISHARIRVAPEHLGAIDLQISVDGERVTAHFQSAHADVRTALESGMHRLREHLAETGLQLTQTQVGSQTSGGTSNGQPRPSAFADHATSAQAGGNGSTVEESAPDAPATVHHVGLVDVYA